MYYLSYRYDTKEQLFDIVRYAVLTPGAGSCCWAKEPLASNARMLKAVLMDDLMMGKCFFSLNCVP